MEENMAEKLVLEPSTEHPISVEQHPQRIVVRAGGQVVADTLNALTLHEAGHSPVFYVPLADVDQTQLSRTDHATYCPYKGDASYYSLSAAGQDGENAVW